MGNFQMRTTQNRTMMIASVMAAFEACLPEVEHETIGNLVENMAEAAAPTASHGAPAPTASHWTSAQTAARCYDTPDWLNGAGKHTCSDYYKYDYCHNGA